MEINFKQKLKTLDGKAIKDAQTKKPISLCDVCINALLTDRREDQIDGKEKLHRYKLATWIDKGYIKHLKAEDLSLVKELIGKSYPPLISGQAWILLDPAEGGEEKPKESKQRKKA